MVATLCLLTCALATTQTPTRGDWLLVPQLVRGQELVYSGTWVEEALSPGVQFHRSYKLETTLLVLDTSPQKSEVAIYTLLSLRAKKARGDSTAWQRRDTVWLSPQLGIAYRVERIIEQRDPLRKEPTHRSVMRYDLDSRLTYPGKLFDDRVHEIRQTRKFWDEAVPM